MDFAFLITRSNFDLLTIGIAGAGIGLLGFLVFLNESKSTTNRTFLWFAILTILWNFSNFFQYQFSGIEATLWALRLNLFIAVWHALLFLRLSIVFPESSMKLPAWYTWFAVPLAAVTSALTLTPLVFSRILEMAPAGEITNPERGFGIIIFSVVTFGFLFLGLGILSRNLMREQGVRRTQTLFVFIGMLVTALLTLFFSVILPIFFDTLSYLPYAAVFMFPFIGLVSFAIYRLKLFNVKVFGAGVLVFILATLTFVEVIFTEGISLLILRVILLGLVISAGVALMGSVIREVRQREEIERLAESLKVANDKLKELDRLKSQFLSMASHDLRAPLTIIRNFVSLLLDGSYGALAPAGKEGLQQVFDRATDMAKSVETYLDVSRIEQGRMKYDFVDMEFMPLVKSSVTAFTPNAEKKGLKLTASYDAALAGVKVKVDVPKMNEVLNNLLDNTIKYTPKGEMNLRLEKRGNLVRLSLKDTGVGMSQDTLKNLFQLFRPGEDSKRINPASTGVGLFVTKAHVEAHQGKIWAESEGVGKGSTFIMELPIVA